MNNFRKFINNDIDESVKLPPKLHRLLRMGLSNKEDLETMRRALRSGHDKAMLSPRLRKQLSVDKNIYQTNLIKNIIL